LKKEEGEEGEEVNEGPSEKELQQIQEDFAK